MVVPKVAAPDGTSTQVGRGKNYPGSDRSQQASLPCRHHIDGSGSMNVYLPS
ncbi:hypothetical protein [Bythopirellula polymerisocia]|uniref:hypothetical protein n=1 Tax=Bythopirellula polymerisocia TaxID=2528003 RepID=UPI0018D2DB6C|nr:hypothetical protein [Bythopirellula polymerisocia]